VLFGGRGCAVRLEHEPTETWSIGTWKDFRPSVSARLPAGAHAIGLLHLPGNGRTGVITLDRTVFRLHSVDGSNEHLYSAPDRIVSCTVCPGTSLIAMLTERRQFIVVSAATREVRLSVHTSRQPHAGE
jgi:hypothetical protein